MSFRRLFLGHFPEFNASDQPGTALPQPYEKDLIEDTLKTTRGNRTKAAALLKTTSRVLNYKIRKLNIDCKRFRG